MSSNQREAKRSLLFYLRKWKYFDTNFAYLSDIEKIQMKILYSSLKVLSNEELKLLSEQYRFADKGSLNDGMMAKEKKVSEYKIKEKKRSIFKHLIPAFIANEKLYKNELKKLLKEEKAQE